MALEKAARALVLGHIALETAAQAPLRSCQALENAARALLLSHLALASFAPAELLHELALEIAFALAFASAARRGFAL